MSKKDKRAQDVRHRIGGQNLHIDASNHIIYYNRFLKKGFFLSPSDLQAYSNISSRYVIAIAVGIMLWVFTKNIIFAIISCIFIAIALTSWFYFKFLTTLNTTDYIPKDNVGTNPFSFVMSTKPISDKLVKIAIGFVLGALLMINTQQQQFTGTNYYLNFALIVISFAFAAVELLALVITLIVKRRSK